MRGARCGSVAAVAAALVAGCGSTEGGFGLPTLDSGSILGSREALAGTLHLEETGCFTWSDAGSERRWVIWPRSARQDGAHVLLPDGTALTAGDALTGEGIREDADALPGWEEEDSYFGSFGRFCDADAIGIVVFDDVARASG